MSKTADERFKEDLEKDYDKLIQVVRDALESTKKMWTLVTCKHCSRQGKYLVEVPNVRDAMAAAEFMANRGIGRPGTVEPGDRQVTHEYVLEIVSPDADAA